MHVLKMLLKEWIIILIILFALFLRLWGLDTQSLWVDELFNMDVADPSHTWQELFHRLKCCDLHPPLYYIIERLFFSVFGHTAFVARIVSVLAGTTSILAVWLLGREILNRSLGLTLALITTVNYYSIYYSQEARGYSFAFLFSVLSALYLIKLIKKPEAKYVLFYALSALCLLYTHYFSLFVLVAHGIISMILLAAEQTASGRIRLFKGLCAAFAIIIVGYLPWIPFLKAALAIKSFWIESIPPDFMQVFFWEYFGNAALLKPILSLLLIVYLLQVSIAPKKGLAAKDNPLVLSFLLITCIIFTSYMIPYVRSLMTVPMLYARYTIVVLPFILLALAFGIESFKNRLVRNMVLAIFIICSLINIIWVRKYYEKVCKTQFRELTEYIVTHNRNNYPVLNGKTSRQILYYFKKLGVEPRLVPEPKEQIVDSILHSNNPEWSFTGFWIAGTHVAPKLPTEKQKELERKYILLRQKDLYDAWGQLYILRSVTEGRIHTFNYNEFSPGRGTVNEREQLLGIWSGYVQTPPFDLAAGDYQITITAKGTDLKSVFPYLNVFIGEKKAGSYYLNGNLEEHALRFHLPESGNVALKIGFDNDEMIEGVGDRNTLLRSVIIERIE